MQIVIDIPNSIYANLPKIVNGSIASKRILDCVKNGTPLPKGHGRLIDADVFEKRLMCARSYYVGEKADDFDLQFGAGLKSAAERLVDAPTIIPADKGV